MYINLSETNNIPIKSNTIKANNDTNILIIKNPLNISPDLYHYVNEMISLC